MRILQGTKLVDAPPTWRDDLEASGRRVVIDLGAGDGRFAFESARRDPESVYIAVDPDAAALSSYAYRAARKPARGGVKNAVFVVAALEQLPSELRQIASLVRVNFPWGSLLRGLLRPEPDALQRLASLARRGGRFEIVFTYDPLHDFGAFPGETLPRLDEADIDEFLMSPYAAAGLEIEARRALTRDEALAIPSTWGRRLLHGRPRAVYTVEGRVSGAAGSANLKPPESRLS
jgi:16S rRNA (adenine(1408)-N(1))-methyltransferase